MGGALGSGATGALAGGAAAVAWVGAADTPGISDMLGMAPALDAGAAAPDVPATAGWVAGAAYVQLGAPREAPHAATMAAMTIKMTPRTTRDRAPVMPCPSFRVAREGHKLVHIWYYFIAKERQGNGPFGPFSGGFATVLREA
jgi:hypothetical protein